MISDRDDEVIAILRRTQDKLRRQLLKVEQKDKRSIARDDDKNYGSWYHKSKITNRKSKIDKGAFGFDSIDL